MYLCWRTAAALDWVLDVSHWSQLLTGSALSLAQHNLASRVAVQTPFVEGARGTVS